MGGVVWYWKSSLNKDDEDDTAWTRYSTSDCSKIDKAYLAGMHPLLYSVHTCTH